MLVGDDLGWEAARARADVFVAQLNLTEKLNFVRGNAQVGGCVGNIEPVPRLGFPGICLVDGPSAVARNELVSVFPAGVTIAATWDRVLMYERGRALGAEFRGKGVNVQLG